MNADLLEIHPVSLFENAYQNIETFWLPSTVKFELFPTIEVSKPLRVSIVAGIQVEERQSSQQTHRVRLLWASYLLVCIWEAVLRQQK